MLPKLYGTLMTYHLDLRYFAFQMEGWQYNAAFVVQFRPETDLAAGRFDGKIEHIPTAKSIKFRSLGEMLDFIAEVLTEVGDLPEP